VPSLKIKGAKIKNARFRAFSRYWEYKYVEETSIQESLFHRNRSGLFVFVFLPFLFSFQTGMPPMAFSVINAIAIPMACVGLTPYK